MAPAAAAAVGVVDVDVAADAGADVAVGAGAVADVGVRILPVHRTRGQRHRVQIRSHLVLSAHHTLHARGAHHKTHDGGANRKVHVLDRDYVPIPVLAQRDPHATT